MSEVGVLLSVKEVGFFASRILVAGHCPAGALPELSRVVAARELLGGGGLVAAAQYAEDDPWVFSDVTPHEVSASVFAARREGAPSFLWVPWVLDRLRVLAGGPSSVMLAGFESDWIPAVLASRGGPGTVWASRGLDDDAYLVHDGIVCRPGPDAVSWERQPAIATGTVQVLARPHDGLDPGLDPTVLSGGVALSTNTAKAQVSGVPIGNDAWALLRRISERTLIPTSERSRQGAG